jgi:hypothetical protein
MFNRLRYVLANYKNLESIIAKEKKEIEEAIKKADSARLILCEKHNPLNKALYNYSEHNCDYCKLLKVNTHMDTKISDYKKVIELLKEVKK